MPTFFHVTPDEVRISYACANSIEPIVIHQSIGQKAEFCSVHAVNRLPAKFREPLRKHDDTDETIVVINGACILITQSGEYLVQSGDIIRIDRGTLHALHTREHAAQLFGSRLNYVPIGAWDYS